MKGLDHGIAVRNTLTSRTGQAILPALKTVRDGAMDTDTTGKVHKLTQLAADPEALDCFFPDFGTPGDRPI